MIPHITLGQRIIAWLLWHFEGYESMDEASFYIIEHPEVTRAASLMCDYWYARKAKEMGKQ